MIPTARSAYLDSSVQTASPARLLVMLCERLVLDCRRGAEALAAADHETASAQLMHAQDIVTELHSSLRTDVWDGAADLSRLYGHLLVSLVQANVRRDHALAVHCQELATQLADTWRDAALQTAAASA